MSDHQDKAKQLPDRGGRLHHYPRSDLEYAARSLLEQCDRAGFVGYLDANLLLAMDRLRTVLGEVKS